MISNTKSLFSPYVGTQYGFSRVCVGVIDFEAVITLYSNVKHLFIYLMHQCTSMLPFDRYLKGLQLKLYTCNIMNRPIFKLNDMHTLIPLLNGLQLLSTQHVYDFCVVS